MNKTPCTPDVLPLQHLAWERLVALIGQARECVARYDETLRDIPLSILEILKWEESIANLRSQNIDARLKEVLQFALNGSASATQAPLLKKILDAKQALDAAIHWPCEKSLGIPFFCRIHAIVKQDVPNAKERGRLRDRQNWIGSAGCPIEKAHFYPPRAEDVPIHLKRWVRYSRLKEPDALVQLAILFAQFLIIHPFMDGNGRVGRMYIPIFACRKKLLRYPVLFLSAYFEEHRLSYFQRLFNISKKDAWEDWIAYFLKGVIQESSRLKTQAEKLGKLYRTIKRTDLFLRPVRTFQTGVRLNDKILFEEGNGLFWFQPIFEAIR